MFHPLPDFSNELVNALNFGKKVIKGRTKIEEIKRTQIRDKNQSGMLCVA